MPYIECHHCNKIIHNVSILKDITLTWIEIKFMDLSGTMAVGKPCCLNF